ncbi:hypothetical protein EVAR_78544_1 [Eumeta japonica]|uniref:Uncharacterized protein n=1 Tax=Eumeta variegata TaxID=151549 RepID=A0A4C1W9P0_EUMVA|nr:hypothetical protein EVAR_78544_1 [Eumeta japonica]
MLLSSQNKPLELAGQYSLRRYGADKLVDSLELVLLKDNKRSQLYALYVQIKQKCLLSMHKCEAAVNRREAARAHDRHADADARRKSPLCIPL